MPGLDPGPTGPGVPRTGASCATPTVSQKRFEFGRSLARKVFWHRQARRVSLIFLPRDRPGDPGTDPGDPGTGPGDRGTGPGDPGTGPGDPGTGPGDPRTGPGDPRTGPGTPGTGLGDPGTDPGVPGTCPGDAGTGTPGMRFPPRVPMGLGQIDDPPLPAPIRDILICVSLVFER
jgi:hypothetical protein